MIWQYRLGILIAIIALVFNALTEAGLIYLLKPLLDKGFGEADLSFLKWLPIIVILLIFLRGITSFVSDYCLSWVSGNVVMVMRRMLFKHLMYMPVSFFDHQAAGKLLSRITYDSEQVANSSSNALITIVKESATVVSLLGLMLYTSWQLSLVLFVVGPIIAVLISVVSKHFRRLKIGRAHV